MNEKRQKVYLAIDSERAYQDAMTKSPARPDMIEDFHVGDALCAIDHLTKAAQGAWYVGSNPHEQTMEYLRKVAGIIVKLGEVHGIPQRKGYEQT